MKGFKNFVIFPDLKGYIKADFDFTVSSSLQFPSFGFSSEGKLMLLIKGLSNIFLNKKVHIRYPILAEALKQH